MCLLLGLGEMSRLLLQASPSLREHPRPAVATQMTGVRGRVWACAACCYQLIPWVVTTAAVLQAATETSASSKRETCLLHQRILGLLLLVQESRSIGVRPIW